MRTLPPSPLSRPALQSTYWSWPREIALYLCERIPFAELWVSFTCHMFWEGWGRYGRVKLLHSVANGVRLQSYAAESHATPSGKAGQVWSHTFAPWLCEQSPFAELCSSLTRHTFCWQGWAGVVA